VIRSSSSSKAAGRIRRIKKTAEIAVLEGLSPAVDSAELERAVDAAIATTEPRRRRIWPVMKAVPPDSPEKLLMEKMVNEPVRRKLGA
jgi:hypothetical protein